MSAEGRVLPVRAPNLTDVLRGTVHSLHRKPETGAERGLPKPAVSEAGIGFAGMEGDFNRYRHEERDDDLDMALLLQPLETLDELRGEGWPIAPGDLGENITTSGIPYHELFPGRTIEVGGARLVVSKPCTPCDNLNQLPYVGGTKGPEFLRTMLGRRGWFARVERPGRVAVGDPIRVLPP